MKMKEPENFVASLDIGSEKMVMALGTKDGDYYRLVGVESVASEGVRRGRVEDAESVQKCVRQLLERFKDIHGFDIDSLNVSLPGNLLRREERVETSRTPRTQMVSGKDLNLLMKRCRDNFEGGDREVVEILPACFKVDKEVYGNPVGRMARQLEAFYNVYTASAAELDGLRDMLGKLGIQEMSFHSPARVFQGAMMEKGEKGKSFAVIDLGAEHVQVSVFVDGLVVRDVELPLGSRVIDADIDMAFSMQDLDNARLLKEEHGEALRAVCKSRKVMIPGTKYSIESHDLSYVVQCRAEELLEGAMFQIQQSGCYERLDDGLFLTGGGSRLRGLDVLLNHLSGFQVRRARVLNMHAKESSKLSDPTWTMALGLLMCERPVEEKKSAIKNVWDRFFKG